MLSQLQLLVFSALAFSVLIRTGIYPPELRSVNLDFDWFYRRFGAWLVAGLATATAAFNEAASRALRGAAQRMVIWIKEWHGADAVLARTWTTGSLALWVALMLAMYLLVVYL